MIYTNNIRLNKREIVMGQCLIINQKSMHSNVEGIAQLGFGTS